MFNSIVSMKTFGFLLATVFSLTSVPLSVATTINAGDQRLLLDTISASDVTLNGTVIVDRTVASSGNAPAPLVAFEVIKRADTGTLDFYYLVGNDDSVNSQFSVTGFAGTTVNVYQTIAPTQTAPGSDSSRSSSGDLVTIGTALGSPDDASLIRTNSSRLPTAQSLTFVSASDVGGSLDSIATYPLLGTPVPEPTTVLLLEIGISAFALRVRHCL